MGQWGVPGTGGKPDGTIPILAKSGKEKEKQASPHLWLIQVGEKQEFNAMAQSRKGYRWSSSLRPCVMPFPKEILLSGRYLPSLDRARQ